MILDNEGYAQFPPRNQNDTFHTDDTWKALGLLNWGTDKYITTTKFGPIRMGCGWRNLKGRLIQEAQRKVWDLVSKVVDLSDHPPKGEHPCARMTAIQKWYIDATNLLALLEP
jgi:hypothetical protein